MKPPFPPFPPDATAYSAPFEPFPPCAATLDVAGSKLSPTLALFLYSPLLPVLALPPWANKEPAPAPAPPPFGQ